MFKITLSPQANYVLDKLTTSIVVSGSKIIYDGIDYDFSDLPENSQVDGEHPAIGVIKKENNVINIKLVYQYNSQKAEFNQSTDINDYIFAVEDGEVPCPIKWKQEQDMPDFALPSGNFEPVIIEGLDDVQS